MAKRKNSVISSEINGSLVTVTTACPSGLRIITIDTALLSDAIREYALADRIRNKLIDAAAQARGTGAIDKYDAMKTVEENLRAGDWSKRGEGTGAQEGGLLVSALARLQPATPREAIVEYVNGKSRSDQAKLRQLPAIAEEIARIHAERGEGKKETADLAEEIAALARLAPQAAQNAASESSSEPAPTAKPAKAGKKAA